MKYGLCLPNGGICADPRLLSEFAALAESSGWDGLFLEDYIIWQGQTGYPTVDPWIGLAVMATSTRQIRLGTLVTPLVRRRPWKVAREAVSLDQLSGGRLILGVGIGDARVDTSLSSFGEESDARKRGRMLDEALAILVGLWSGNPFSFQGEFYQVGEVTCLPQPVQPRIPIWIGGGYPLEGPTRRAARFDGSCMYMHSPDGSWRDWTPQEVSQLKALVEGQRAAGFPLRYRSRRPRTGERLGKRPDAG